MKKILVTGGAGYVGSSLLRVLLNKGYEVVCVDCLMFGGESLLNIWHHPNFTFYKCDITDFDKFDKILQKDKYDAVVHLAAIVGDPACKRQPELANKVNWEASKHLLEKCMELNVLRFVFASTCSNYGKMSDPNAYVDENSPLAPVSLYAELKVKFEDLILNSIEKREDFCPTALRFSTVYGISPRMRFDLTVNEFTKELALGKELVVFGEQFWRPYCHVTDFSRAIMAVLTAQQEKVAYNVFNVGSTEENYTKQMIVEALLKRFPGADIKYVYKAEDPRDYRVNFDKIKRELGFMVSTTVPEGIEEIKKVIRWGIIADPEDQRYYNIPHIRE
ncbi:MAG: NAD(P)-dependent oxidoreductase [Deltaproteobacteria bacterium]|nr:NAD(P)-dependent oxidoreductase [Deltaproteobacteria bacterium]MBW2018618.1 NAD(P)-dependent oxidoreductase [Deltaproteobacteria bacterium]MBW2073884.1 NAD(P)-dependent oxidoreductase [Deltaproteobacteria bacterium]